MNKRRMVKITYAFIAVTLFMATLELSVYTYVSIYENRYVFRDFSTYVLDDEERERRVKKRFNAALGWEHYHKTPFGERRRPVSYERDLIATFGDSFTWGTDLQNTETWQTVLSAMLGRNVFNFGATAYGTDQAFLRYLRDHKKIDVRISILSLIPENINRLANVYRKFYFKRTGLPATKPYYTVVDGQVVLNENPIQQVADISRLKDVAFVRQLAEFDYWASLILKSPRKGFPYMGLLFDLDFLSQTKDILLGNDAAKYSEARFSHNLWNHPIYVKIMKYIFAAFVQEARNSGETPIVMMLPQGQSIASVLAGQPYRGEKVVQDECRKNEYLCIFPAEFMAQRIGTVDKIPLYYFRNGRGHPTPLGAKLIAQAVYRFLQDNQLIDD